MSVDSIQQAGLAGAGAPKGATPPEERDAALMRTARAFEAAFIGQMLTHSGLPKALGANAGFGGEAFSAFMVEAYAEQLAEAGGFGLADNIYRQLQSLDAQNGGTDAA